MALPGFLYRNLVAGLLPTVNSSVADSGFPYSNLLNPQPRVRVRRSGDTSMSILYDLGSVQTFDTWYLGSTSLTRNCSVRIKASITDPLSLTGLTLNTGLVSDDFTDAQYNGNVVMCFPESTARFGRIDISGADDPISIGIVLVGLLFRPANATEYGVQEGFIDYSIRDENEDTGAEYALSGPKKKTLQFTMAGDEDEVRGFLTSFSDMDRVVGASGDVLFVEDSDADALTRARDSVYGRYREVGASTATRVANELWTRVFQMRERK